MRIAVLTSLYPSPERPFEGIFAERRWVGMRARGHAVRVVQPLPLSPGALGVGSPDWRAIAKAPRREQRSGIAIERPRYLHWPRAALGNARRFARTGLAAVARHGTCDVLVCDYAWPAAQAAPSARALGLPVVISGRGSDVLQVAADARLARELAGGLRAAGHWCGVSEDLVRALDRLGEGAGRGVLVPNGVDLVRFAPRDRRAARERLGLERTGALVLVVGHLIERKDPLLAAAAFAAGAPSGARLAFLGRGPLRGALELELERLGLGARASILGERDPAELADWYAAADLLLLCSTREGRPNVVLEALASGRAVLATEAGGTAELLGGLPGTLAKTREPAELGRLLAGLLAAPPCPERCRAQVEQLSWERSLEALERCLSAAIASGRASA